MCHHHRDQLREIEFELVEEPDEVEPEETETDPERPPAIADGGEAE